MNLAQIPVEWKGIALAGVGFAVTSGVRRATRTYTIGRDVEKVAKAVNAPETIEFQPHTEKTYRKYKLARRGREAGVATAATVGGYVAGTQLGVNGNLLVGTLGVGAAYGKVQFERVRSVARGY